MRHALAALACLLCLVAVARPSGADEEVPAPSLPEAEAPEEPLEGALRRQYAAERSEFERELRTAREPGEVENVMRRLAALPGRAGRDAVIRFVRSAKDPQLMNLAVNLMARRTDGVALRFVCGPDGLGSMHAHSMDSWATNAIESAKNPALVPYLLEVAAERKTKALVMGLAIRMAAKMAPTDPRVIEAAFRVVRHKQAEARYPALEALGHIATPEAIEVLLEAGRSDRDATVRGSAYTGVANAGRFDLLPQLRALLQREGSAAVKSEAGDAIRKLEALEADARAAAGK
jgi:hypothetical protein